MKVERGASQILFGLLPGQTADLEGRIWRVANWVDPVQTALDQDTVRSALIGAIAPWAATGNDDGLTAELRARAAVDIVRLNMDRGVLVEPFPQQWRCKTCGTITRSRDEGCPCGGRTRAQMQFVAYHTCGAAREPSSNAAGPTTPSPCISPARQPPANSASSAHSVGRRSPRVSRTRRATAEAA